MHDKRRDPRGFKRRKPKGQEAANTRILEEKERRLPEFAFDIDFRALAELRQPFALQPFARQIAAIPPARICSGEQILIQLRDDIGFEKAFGIHFGTGGEIAWCIRTH
ncbi:hypothetical protein ACFFUC_17375 [Paracoccus cavernae]